MTTHDAPTEPATYLTITIEHLLRLDAAYPAARWWLKANDEGDEWAGPLTDPLKIMEDIDALDTPLREQYLNNLDGARLGMFNEDAMLLLHQDELVRAGADAAAAETAGRHLLGQVYTAMEMTGQDDGPLFGFRAVFEVTDEGEILLAPLSGEGQGLGMAEVSA